MGGKNVLTLPRAITFLNIWKIIAIISIIKRCHFSINLENDKVLKAVVYWLVRTTFSGLTVMRVKTSGAPLIRHLNWNSNKLEILTTSQSSPSRQVSMFSKKWLVWENVVKFSVYLRDSMEERWRTLAFCERWDNWKFLPFLWSVFHRQFDTNHKLSEV